MKNILLIYLVLIIFILFGCSSNQNVKMLVQIDFQDFFENDTISLSIDENLIFTKEIISSHPSMGFALISIKIFSFDSSTYKVDKISYKLGSKPTIEEKVFELPSLKIYNKLDMVISVNGKSKKLKLYLSNGRYIGIDKSKDHYIEIHQFDKAFEYE